MAGPNTICMDPRIKVGLKALEILEKLERNGRIRADLKDVRAVLKSCQWIDDVIYLKNETEKLKNPIEYACNPKDEPVVKWCVDTFTGLSRKFKRGEGRSILLGLDCALGTIVSCRKLGGGLTVCRVDSTLGRFTIVTNLDVKNGGIHPFVVLPPRKIGGVLSEAMFVWGAVASMEEVDWKKVEGDVSALLA